MYNNEQREKIRIKALELHLANLVRLISASLFGDGFLGCIFYFQGTRHSEMAFLGEEAVRQLIGLNPKFLPFTIPLLNASLWRLRAGMSRHHWPEFM